MSDVNAFQVVYSAALRNHIKELIDQAKLKDMLLANNMLHALSILDGRMRREPFDLGEPRFSLPELHLKVRIAVETPLAISFAVHEQLPIVFVQAVRMLVGN
ncbi:MAG: hypothetical protein FJ271_14795 [Planctomycetes bacterium]|nr:hypothetical protein [Planctomycetota bacterium]